MQAELAAFPPNGVSCLDEITAKDREQKVDIFSEMSSEPVASRKTTPQIICCQL